MATRSSIAIWNIDGTVHGHYCHNGGYLSYNGSILYKHYKDVNKVKELVALGDMSSLHQEVSPPNGVKHSFDESYQNTCVFYERDRGETGVETQKYESLEDYIDNGNFQEYDYIFNEKKNQWYVIHQTSKKLQKLTTLLKKDREVRDDVKNMIQAEEEAKKIEKMAKELEKNLKKKAVSFNKSKV